MTEHRTAFPASRDVWSGVPALTPPRVALDVQLACLADAANLSQEGKLNILGEFNNIFADQVPVTWPLMVFVAKIQVSAGDGQTIHFSLRVVGEDGQLISQQSEMQLQLPPNLPAGETPGVPLILHIMNATFPEFGAYDFELRGNGTLIKSIPLTVRPIPQQASGSP